MKQSCIICCFIPFSVFKWYVQNEDLQILRRFSLCEKCPNMEFFLVCIFLYSVQIQENKDQKKLCIRTLFTQCLCVWVPCLSINFDINISALIKRLHLFDYLERFIKPKIILTRILKVSAPCWCELLRKLIFAGKIRPVYLTKGFIISFLC